MAYIRTQAELVKNLLLATGAKDDAAKILAALVTARPTALVGIATVYGEDLVTAYAISATKKQYRFDDGSRLVVTLATTNIYEHVS